MKEDNRKQQEQGAAEPSKPEATRSVSERKARANRENAKKSTGPKTARGRRNSSFNALKHGLLAKKVMLAADGTPLNQDLATLFGALRAEYGCGDVVSELLAELVAVDYWRLQKGLEYEMKYLTPKGGEFHPQGGMPTLVRYVTANRHAFEKNLQMLMQRKAVTPAMAIRNDDHPLDATQTGETPTPPIPGGNPRSALAVAVSPVADGEPLNADEAA